MCAIVKKPRLIVILGSTAVGKTAAAMALARESCGEIVSADSMQVYKLLDIGTAKPTLEEQFLVKHHLIDVVNPDEQFNAAMFIRLAEGTIRKLHDGGKPIFVVGGTGLYIRALLGGLFEGPDADEDLRRLYRQELKQFGKTYLYEKLKERDEQAAAQIDKNDIPRTIRALEVLELCGLSIVEKQKAHHFGDNLYDFIKIGLTVERTELYQRIDKRTEKMIEDGLIDEVERLFSLGYHENLKPMQALGYKHIARLIKGSCNLVDATRMIKRDTRHFAKRQMTWFGRDGEIEWFAPSDLDAMRRRIDHFLSA
ncbi:MAG: tRNA (adenosine(37)-N6)-dimethylallyltransferase MiaA [Syntrophales bacterium]|jgi:tRNA dimethylallyltransferase